jgi:hypothetical protein
MGRMKAWAIHTVCLEDAEAVLSLQREVIDEGEFFMVVSEEYNKAPEQQRESIPNILENDRKTMLVTEMVA